MRKSHAYETKDYSMIQKHVRILTIKEEKQSIPT